jgi:predicted metalloprotease with PDZ domain
MTSWLNTTFDKARHTPFPDLIDKVPYWKGFLLAHKWETELKAQNSSLLQAINLFVRKNKIISRENVSIFFEDLGIESASTDIEQFIFLNNGPAVTQRLYAKKGQVETFEYDEFNLGFEVDEKHVVTRIEKGSAAYRAGVRSGMVIKTLNYTHNSPQEDALVSTDGGDVFIFKPSKKHIELKLLRNGKS